MKDLDLFFGSEGYRGFLLVIPASARVSGAGIHQIPAQGGDDEKMGAPFIFKLQSQAEIDSDLREILQQIYISLRSLFISVVHYFWIAPAPGRLCNNDFTMFNAFNLCFKERYV